MSSNKDIEDQRPRMDPMILQQIKKMGIAEKCELLKRLKALIAKKMADSALAGTPKRCPRCKSLSFYCKGHDAHGSQRWKCCS
jgi:transposase-like protein